MKNIALLKQPKHSLLKLILVQKGETSESYPPYEERVSHLFKLEVAKKPAELLALLETRLAGRRVLV